MPKKTKPHPFFADSCVFMSGILLTLSFAPFNNPPFAIIALLILQMSWQEVSISRAVLRGFLFGLGQFGVGIAWLFAGLHEYAGMGVLAACVITLLLIVYLALFPALVGWFSLCLLRHNPLLRLLWLFPCVWVYLEWLRSWLFTGFPWLQLGYSQIDTPLAGLAPITGVYGLSWVTAYSAASLLVIYKQHGWQRWFVSGLLILIWGGAGMLGTYQWTRPFAKPFQATLIQANIPLQLKWQAQQREQTLRIYTEMSRQHMHSKLIIWPETALPVLYDSLDAEFVSAFKNELLQQDSELLFGVIAGGESPGIYYNAMQLWGHQDGIYYKRHLVPFGEYNPFPELAKWFKGGIDFPGAKFSRGMEQQPLIWAAEHQLQASICYEDLFGQQLLYSLPQVAYLVNISDDGWWGKSLAPYQHLQMARMRALETGRFLLKVANSGLSAFIDAKGRIIKRTSLFERSSLSAWVIPMTGSTPYIYWGDYWLIMLLLVSGVMVVVVRYTHKPHR